MSDNTDKVTVKIMRETDKAYMFENDDLQQAWFPKSQVSFIRRNVNTGEAVAEIPEWLLNKAGW